LLEHGAQLRRIVVVMHGDSVLHSGLDQFVHGWNGRHGMNF